MAAVIRHPRLSQESGGRDARPTKFSLIIA
jgi:hypothetical protein